MIDFNTLRACLKFVSHAQGVHDVRYYLNGTLFQFDAEAKRLSLVATDGHRLAAAEIECESGFTGEFILPSSQVADIIKGSHAGQAMFAPGEKTLVILRGNGDTDTYSTIDGKYPDWRRVVPKAGTEVASATPYQVNSQYLADAAKAYAGLLKKCIMSMRFYGNESAMLFKASELPSGYFGLVDLSVIVMPTWPRKVQG